MKQLILITFFVVALSSQLVAAEGVINVPSSFNVATTADRLENVLNKKGMTIFNRIQHSAGAAKIGVTLRDTELIIFGNPKVGSPLMECQQSVALDLPQKTLIWEDAEGQVWISYNDPKYLQQRHSIDGCNDIITKIEKALAGIAKTASTD